MNGTSRYYDLERTRRYIATGRHRDLVGGFWDEIGTMTMDLVVDCGLRPEMSLVDIGCGCFRVGRHLVEYLEPGKYYGVDLSEELLEVGYEREIQPRGLARKLPRSNLLCDEDFSFDRFVGRPQFDMALAKSLFTHLSINHLRLCLEKLEKVMTQGGRLVATVFHSREEDWASPLVHEPGNVTTYPTRDPFHYRAADLERCTEGTSWTVARPRPWNHPRSQAYVVFTKSPRAQR